MVGLGDSEGGNAWASDYWKRGHDQFIKKDTLLAIGYFGCENTPELLDKIAIDDIHYATSEAAKNMVLCTASIYWSTFQEKAIVRISYKHSD